MCVCVAYGVYTVVECIQLNEWRRITCDKTSSRWRTNIRSMTLYLLKLYRCACVRYWSEKKEQRRKEAIKNDNNGQIHDKFLLQFVEMIEFECAKLAN